MIALEFDIEPGLYRRAITYPIPGQEPPSQTVVMLRNLGAAILFPLSLTLLTLAFFDWDRLTAVFMGGAVGAGLVLAVWWRQHKRLVAHHDRYNRTAGTQSMRFDEKGIVAAREGIESHIGWSFVSGIRAIPDATLIEVQTARLIVPDTALEGSADSFRAQLEAWRGT
jgi:hypothetical protein